MKKVLLAALLTLGLSLTSGLAALANGGPVHVVQWGETLSAIAYSYGVTAEAVMAANELSDPDLVYIGQRLIIPTGEDDQSHGEMGYNYYTVQAEDTLNTIAEEFQTTASALAIANNLDDADFIYVGQVLNVPGMRGSDGSDSPGPAPAMPTGRPGGQRDCPDPYVVQWGDTLSAIAWRYGASVNELLQINNLYSEIIYEGQRICVPGRANGGPMSPAAEQYYTVKKGDTISAIAYRYGASVAAIIKVNSLSNTGLIYEGQKLVIPPPGYNPGPMMPSQPGRPEGMGSHGDRNGPSWGQRPGGHKPDDEQQKASIDIMFDDLRYEQWGSPTSGLESCSGDAGPFDNNNPVRRFTVSFFVTYNAPPDAEPLDGSWASNVWFHTQQGGWRRACIWPTTTTIWPGETVNVTFYTHFARQDERVKDVHLRFPELSADKCLRPSIGDTVDCDHALRR